ncbi:hypothetical protein [Micromonospora zhanjiangensis]
MRRPPARRRPGRRAHLAPSPAGTPTPADAPTGPPAGPATPDSSTPPADPGLSSTVLPTLRPPVKPPQEPTDQLRPNVIGGQLTRGGSGPCFGLVADDGVEYALYGRDVGTFAKGTRVLVTIAPLQLRIDCGSGRPVSIVRISEVR